MTLFKGNSYREENASDNQESYFFLVKIFTSEQRPYLRQYPELKKLAEKYWRKVMLMYPQISSDEFGTTSNCLQAIVFLQAEPTESMDSGNLRQAADFIAAEDMVHMIENSISFYRSLIELEWRKKAETLKINMKSPIWDPVLEIEGINRLSRLGEVRRAIHGGRIRDSINEDFEDDWGA